VYVGPVEDRHNAGLADFFEVSWGQDESEEGDVATWRAREASRNPAEPGVEPPKWVFTREERVLGYLGTIPARFAAGGDAFTAYWLKGFWVDPDYRSGPVGFEISKCAVQQLGATAASVVGPEARRLFEAQGLVDRGVLFNRLLLLRPGRVLSLLDPDQAMAGIPSAARVGLKTLQATGTAGLAGGLASPALKVAAALRGRGRAELRVTEGWDTIDRRALDALWREFSGTVKAAAVRDGAFVTWRYADGDRYHAVAVWDGDRLRGWAALRRPSPSTSDRLRGVSVASLSDLLFPIDDPGVGLRLLAATEAVAARLGADTVLCSGSLPVLRRVLTRRSFAPIPGNLHFLTRDADQRSFPTELDSWWLTRGDAESDGAF
jgi:hypothetical protein